MPDLGMRFLGEARNQQAHERQPAAAAASAGGQEPSWWQKFTGYFQTSRTPAAEPSLEQSQHSGEAQYIELAGNQGAFGGVQAKAPLPKDLDVNVAKNMLVDNVINSVGSNEIGVNKLIDIVENPQEYLDREFQQTIAHKDAAGGKLHVYPEALRNSDEEKAHLKELLQEKAVEKLGRIASNTTNAALIANIPIDSTVRTKALDALGKILIAPQVLGMNVRGAAWDWLRDFTGKQLSSEKGINQVIYHRAMHHICMGLLDSRFYKRDRDVIFAELERLYSRGFHIDLNLNPEPYSMQRSPIVDTLLQRAQQNEQSEERDIARENLARLYPMCREVSRRLNQIERDNPEVVNSNRDWIHWIRGITNPGRSY